MDIDDVSVDSVSNSQSDVVIMGLPCSPDLLFRIRKSSLGVPVGQHGAVSLELTCRSQDEEMISMPMCLPNSQDDDSMMMYLSKSQDDYIMPMCLSNSQSDAVIMGLPC
jgi:hypothetical protein